MIRTLPGKRIQQEMITLRGGLNEEVTDYYLKSGELVSCVNYQEEEGTAIGYASVPGYERFDGQPLASSIPVTLNYDTGRDGRTQILLESEPQGDNVINDYAIHTNTITATGVVNNTNRRLYGASSFRLADGTITIGHREGLEIGEQDFCLEFFVYFLAANNNATIISKGTSFEVTLVDGFLNFDGSTDGLGFDIPLSSTSQLIGGVWHHCAIFRLGGVCYLAVNGKVEDSFAAAAIHDNTDDLVITFTGSLDQLRLSVNDSRYTAASSFLVPKARFSSNGFFAEYVDDADREAQRALIGEVPGSLAVRGVVQFLDKVYAFRDNETATLKRMWVATADGWEEVDLGTLTLAPGGECRFSIYRFDSFALNQPILVVTDGVSTPFLFDGSTITPIDSAELPGDKYPLISGAFNNRLFLGYENSLIFSDVGDPTNYSAITGGAGELFLGANLTDIKEAPGNVLVLLCGTEFIKILKEVNFESNLWAFKVETFTKDTGGYAKTAQTFLGDVYFMGEAGLTSLSATNTYGDFSQNQVTGRVGKTFKNLKPYITCTLVNPLANQLRVYFSNGRGVYLTFDKEKVVRSATMVSYWKAVHQASVAFNQAGVPTIYFASSDGYVYKMDSGTSFDGLAIDTQLQTSHYAYGSPRHWKRFLRLAFMTTADRGLTFGVRQIFSHSDQQLPKGGSLSVNTLSASGFYGSDQYGFFTYGKSSGKGEVYLRGHGDTMALEIRTSSKYKKPHIIQNLIVDYMTENRRM
jgi:hypothetical protein